MKKFAILLLVTFLFGCQSLNHKSLEISENEVSVKQHSNTSPIIGGVETVYVPPFEIPFQARIDTGAETSSIDAKNIRPFERDGEKWVSFDITNKKTSQTIHFEFTNNNPFAKEDSMNYKKGGYIRFGGYSDSNRTWYHIYLNPTPIEIN